MKNGQDQNTGADRLQVNELCEPRTLPDGKIIFPTGVVSYHLFTELLEHFQQLHRRLDYLITSACEDDLGAPIAMDLAFEQMEQNPESMFQKYQDRAEHEKDLAGGNDVTCRHMTLEEQHPVDKASIQKSIKVLQELAKEGKGKKKHTAKRKAA